jgi:hypothetical protein
MAPLPVVSMPVRLVLGKVAASRLLGRSGDREHCFDMYRVVMKAAVGDVSRCSLKLLAMGTCRDGLPDAARWNDIASSLAS